MSLGLRLWARIHLEVEDVKVQINDHQPCRQGDDDDIGNQLLGCERRLGLVERSIENVMAELLAVTRQIPELEEDAGAGKTETDAPESTRG